MDNFLFITLKGNDYEAAAYNKFRSALKCVKADLDTMCDEFENDNDNVVKIQLSNASKLIQVITLVGNDSNEKVDIAFDILDNNYAEKAIVKNENISIKVNCADKNAIEFLEIPDGKKYEIFESVDDKIFSISITDSEFKCISNLTSLNKDTVRVFFNRIGGDVYISEIESTDDNVRESVNEIIQNSDYTAFENFEKLYSKKIDFTDYVNDNGSDRYIGCFNKSYFSWIDVDDKYTIEFHNNKIRFISYDGESSIKTYVCLTPVRFV